MGHETDQGTRAVMSAKAAGVQHLVWSTLPNCQEISAGKYEVIHFTGKALVDVVVKKSGFPHYTFVEAPMYFQNFLGMMAPQPLGDRQKGWRVAMNPTVRGLHVGDPTDLGRVVSCALERPEEAGRGQYLAQASELLSWQEIVEILNRQGHNFTVQQVSNEVYDALPFPGAQELREMMNFFEDYTYFGPDADNMLGMTRKLCPEGFTSFATWASTNMKS